jgi:NADH-quinone oxidoreductase subunit H
MILMASLTTTLFLGGWSFPFITDPADHSVIGGLISIAVFSTKVVLLMFTYVWIRWTLPRFRYDQLMNIGWKGLLPVALVNIAVLAVIGVYLGE